MSNKKWRRAVGSSAAEDNKEAEEEVGRLWEFISSKLFDKEMVDAKEKIRFNV